MIHKKNQVLFSQKMILQLSLLIFLENGFTVQHTTN